MSISSRQAKKETNRIVEERMKDGYIPTVDYLTAKMGEFYNQYRVGFPFLKARHQLYRKVFSTDAYNSNLTEIYEDLNNLYEELVDQFTTVLKDFDYFDTERRKLLFMIKELHDQLVDLTLVANDTEGYVYSIHDNFIDRSKIDLTNSTCEINTEAQITTLKESRSGITKVDMSHYFTVVNYPVLAESKYASNILSNTIFPMSKFGNCFSDINSSWTQNIVTNTPGELQVSFIVNLSPNDDYGQLISRIEARGQSPKPMYIEPLYSIDNINFVSLPLGHGERNKISKDDKVTVWNFDALRVRYIKFLITKPEEDEQTSQGGLPAYRYIIGFKHIEFYTMGYNTSSVLYSNAFTVLDPAGETMTIDKAAIVVEEDVQQGTWIDYYLSLGEAGETDPSKFNWAAISPTNDLIPSEQQVVDFKHVAFFRNIPEIQWDAVSYGTPLETYYGIDFYKIYEFPYEPVKNSVVLYRGKDNWQVTPTYDVVRTSVYGEKHTFGNADTIQLSFPAATPVMGEGLIRGSVKVKADASSDSDTYNTPGDYTISYAGACPVITKARTAIGQISSDPGSPSNTIYVDYDYDEETPEPTIYTTYVYIMNPAGLDINHIPFIQADMDDGQFTKITTPDGEIDYSASPKIHLAPGWHRVSTTAEPESADDRFFSVNSSNYLQSLVYTQYAYSEVLQETSWFELKYNTSLADHGKYAIVDYDGDGTKEIVVNYKPQTAKWGDDFDDLLCANGQEEIYVLTYKFITAATNNIYFKAVFNRESVSLSTATPTLHSYTIKLGY